MKDYNNKLFQIRAVGVLVENDKILLTKQKVNNKRGWSLPGGRLEHGETLEQGVVREIWEETGLKVKVKKLLYVCDKPVAKPPLLHITFLLEKISGAITLPTNEFEETNIDDVKMVDVEKLVEYGFSEKFKQLVKNDFPQSGDYVGLKNKIGL